MHIEVSIRVRIGRMQNKKMEENEKDTGVHYARVSVFTFLVGLSRLYLVVIHKVNFYCYCYDLTLLGSNRTPDTKNDI